MRVYVITACYNYVGKLERYINSFNRSFYRSEDKDIRFRFIFVNDEPGTEKDMKRITGELCRSPRVRYSIHNNAENFGVTYSRNWAARAIFKIFGTQLDRNDLIIYFDADDIWTKDAVDILASLRYNDSNFIFLPVWSEMRDIDYEISGVMPLYQFMTYVPMQECIYCWRVTYASRLLHKYGFLWYEDEVGCKLYPEDIMFHLNPEHECNVLVDAVICHRDYSEGNYTKDWEDTIRKNKHGFKVLSKCHRKNMEKYQYQSKLIEYVEYIEEIVNEGSNNS